jgi:hypothetical protein
MPDGPRVQELLAELLDRQATPEEVCVACPELLPVVSGRWRQICRARAELDALLPIWPHGSLPTMPPEEVLPQVPGYEVESILGRGGMGVVYKARHLALKRTVALKMLAAGHPHPAERARFRAEAEAVARLQHPNVVQIHEVGESDGRPFIALEYVAGGSLAGRLAARPLPPRDAARLVAALAEAMHLAHSRNLVHRDLKPANVLLAGESDAPAGQCQPKVTDFGLVRQLDADAGQTFEGEVMGTPSYLAPEQAEGRTRSPGPAVDVYGLGAILYECLTGRPPFRGATPIETLEQVRSQEPAAPSSLNREAPRDLETICLKCLRKEPEQRYSSARELADDLERFVRGEPVAARPVGGLERAAMWVRRNPTVAGLSSVAALSVMAGAVLSLLFGVEARRKADELQQQTIQLKAQTCLAQENARRAEENAKETGRELVTGLLISIGRKKHRLGDPLDAAEADAMRRLRTSPAPLRLQFLETALHDPETARRVGRRADWIVQAIVGCDRALRAEVARLVVRRIQEPSAPQNVRLACAQLGLALNLADRAWAEHSADALLGSLRDPLVDRTDYLALAQALAAVCERLPPDQAANYAAQATAVLVTRLQDRLAPVDHKQLGQAVVALSPRLDATAATWAASDIAPLIRKSNLHPSTWPSISRALAAVCRRLPPPAAASYVNETLDFVLAARGATTDKTHWGFHASALGALGERLDAARVARVAEAIVGTLSDGEVHLVFVALGLAEATEHLDAEGSLRTAEQLVLVLRNSKENSGDPELLKPLLLSVCRRLDAAGTARVSEAMVAAVRDCRTSIHVHALFAHVFVVLCGRLDEARATSLEDALVGALVADLADAKYSPSRSLLGRALASVCGRPGASPSPSGAEALVAAIRDPQTPLGALKPLAEALAVAGRKLVPAEAALHANQAVAMLGSLWVAKKAPGERAVIAGALAAVWTFLGPDEAVAHATRTADELQDAFRNTDATMEHHSLALALAEVCGHLTPAERVKRTNAVADALIAALRKPGTDYLTLRLLSETLAALSLSLDRPGTVRVADAQVTVLGENDFRTYQYDFCEGAFKKVAARLEEPDLQQLLDHPLAAGRSQRVILDVLGETKHARFRNTWDYLDWTGSHEKGTAAQSQGRP